MGAGRYQDARRVSGNRVGFGWSQTRKGRHGKDCELWTGAAKGTGPSASGRAGFAEWDFQVRIRKGASNSNFCSNSHGFRHRDSFANIVDLLDDMFERCASADEPSSMNFIKKHSEELVEDGVTERVAARLFSNP